MLRRSLAYAIADAGRAVGVLVRQIGGVRTLRDHPGSGRDPLKPTDAATQRQALALIAHNVLSIDSLAVTPALQRRLVPDFDDRGDNPALPTDYPVPQRLLDLQRAVLNQLMSDTVAARILDSVGKTDRPDLAFQLSELYARLNRDIWTELGKGGEHQRHAPRTAARTCQPRGRHAGAARPADPRRRTQSAARAGGGVAGSVGQGAEAPERHGRGHAGSPAGQRRHAVPGAVGEALSRRGLTSPAEGAAGCRQIGWQRRCSQASASPASSGASRSRTVA